MERNKLVYDLGIGLASTLLAALVLMLTGSHFERVRRLLK